MIERGGFMKLGYDLKLEQSQKLVMTPELRQAIELLQFNSIELKEYIRKELEENPMLEVENQVSKEESLEEHTDKDVDWGEYFDNSNSYEYKSERDKNQKQTEFESFIRYSPTMNDDLLLQLNVALDDEEEKDIGHTIIKSLDNDGYLQTDLDFISTRHEVDIEKVERVLKVVQGLEPRGVGARNLKECLLLQVEEDFEDRKLVERIIERYLDDLAHNRIEKISKGLKVDRTEVIEAIEYIRGLDPRPGRCISDECEGARYILPDAEIKLVDGRYQVILNDVTGPRLNINNFYRDMMKDNSDKKTVDFLNNRFDRALWVIRSIEQRRETIKKILESILKYQKEFFIEGEKSLKPLTMQEVARDIDMHESTVSRASNDKYVQTPRGLFEIKYFFTSGLEGADGDVSSTSIKARIKDLIDNENREKPYSDQKISDILGENGVKISRRTVAKYRNEMSILSSSMRRGL